MKKLSGRPKIRALLRIAVCTAPFLGLFSYAVERGDLMYGIPGYTGPATAVAPASAPPTLAFTTTVASVLPGQRVGLNWNATNATSCIASNGWGGAKAANGYQISDALTVTTTFSLSCTGPGGTTAVSRTVAVAGGQTQQPQVSLRAVTASVPPGGSATLSWSAANATACTASGGWQGPRAASGTEVVGPIHGRTTFTINCSGPGGAGIAMTSVAMNGTVQLHWQAPTRNVNGTPLTGLASFRIYYGTEPGVYPYRIEVGPNQRTAAIARSSGPHYFVMTAVNTAGAESAYSNQVVKIVP